MDKGQSVIDSVYSSVASVLKRATARGSAAAASDTPYLPLRSSNSSSSSSNASKEHYYNNNHNEKTSSSTSPYMRPFSSLSSTASEATSSLSTTANNSVASSSQPSPRNSLSHFVSPWGSINSQTTTTPSRPSSSRSSLTYCRIIHSLFNLAILALALVGLFSIVAFLVGLIQQTPIYSERALQDSGWTRRPIRLSGSVTGGSSSDGDKSSITNSNIHTPIYHGITVHDFTPSYPVDPVREATTLKGVYASTPSSEGDIDTDTKDDNTRPRSLQKRSPYPSSSTPLHPFSGRRSSDSSSSDSEQPLPTTLPTQPSNSLHLLILCPLRNSAKDLPHLFHQLDNLSHPFANTSLGFLIGDEDDSTGDVLFDLVQERMKVGSEREYRHVTLLHKDFNVEMPSGGNRHSYFLQQQRRTVMARARTYLLTATLEPSVDWVLWLDSDIAEFSPTLFEDLLVYGNGGVIASSAPSSTHNDILSNHIIFQQEQTRSLINLDHGIADASSSTLDHSLPLHPRKEWNDVIIPNAMRRNPDATLLGFDMNNWAETPESRSRKESLRPDELLIEGNIWQHMHREHLADFYTSYVNSSSPRDQQEAGPQVFSLSTMDTISPDDPRLDTSSDAYIGRLMPLDGIGGVAALVRAEVHRMGAIFPSWIFENQLETEAFGVLAKKMGARVVGLPNLFVLHSK